MLFLQWHRQLPTYRRRLVHSGVDWGMVASYVDIGNSLDTFVGPLEGYNTAGKMQRTESIISMSAASASSAAGWVAPEAGLHLTLTPTLILAPTLTMTLARQLLKASMMFGRQLGVQCCRRCL